MAAAVVSFANHLANLGAQAGGFRHDVADVARLELDGQTANAVRYVFTEWERAAGVKSNFGAQAERLAAGIYREALHSVAAERKRTKERTGIRLALDAHEFHVRKIPLSDRGWSTLTAKPSGASSGGFPMRTVQIAGDKNGPDWAKEPVLVTVGSTEEWALLPAVVRGWDGPVNRRRVVEVYRAIAALEQASAEGPRLVVALNLMYGQRSPAADYQAFGDIAPLIHLTKVALGLATKATQALRRELTERRYGAWTWDDEGERSALVAAEMLSRTETVSPREAVTAALHRLQGPERRSLAASLTKSARLLLATASNALLYELRRDR